jgi:hypothetical protein
MRLKTAAIITLLSVCAYQSHGAGLYATGEIVLRDLQPGADSSMTGLFGRVYQVRSTFETSVELKIAPEYAEGASLGPGCEKIPDISWVRVEKGLVTLVPGGSVSTDIRVSVPNNNRYRGRKYQFYIVSETLPKGTGMVYGVGIKSRMIFTVKDYTGIKRLLRKLHLL